MEMRFGEPTLSDKLATRSHPRHGCSSTGVREGLLAACNVGMIIGPRYLRGSGGQFLYLRIVVKKSRNLNSGEMCLPQESLRLRWI